MGTSRTKYPHVIVQCWIHCTVCLECIIDCIFDSYYWPLSLFSIICTSIRFIIRFRAGVWCNSCIRYCCALSFVPCLQSAVTLNVVSSFAIVALHYIPLVTLVWMQFFLILAILSSVWTNGPGCVRAMPWLLAINASPPWSPDAFLFLVSNSMSRFTWRDCQMRRSWFWHAMTRFSHDGGRESSIWNRFSLSPISLCSRLRVSALSSSSFGAIFVLQIVEFLACTCDVRSPFSSVHALKMLVQ